jgi:hypothetical protein
MAAAAPHRPLLPALPADDGGGPAGDLRRAVARRGPAGAGRDGDRPAVAADAADPPRPRRTEPAALRPSPAPAGSSRHPARRRALVGLQLPAPVAHRHGGGERRARPAARRVRRRAGARHVVLRRVRHGPHRQPRHQRHAGLLDGGDADAQPHEPAAAGGDHRGGAGLHQPAAGADRAGDRAVHRRDRAGLPAHRAAHHPAGAARAGRRQRQRAGVGHRHLGRQGVPAGAGDLRPVPQRQRPLLRPEPAPGAGVLGDLPDPGHGGRRRHRPGRLLRREQRHGRDGHARASGSCSWRPWRCSGSP